VGRLFTTTVRRWTPVVGQERLPSPGDPGRVAVEDTIHRLFVDGVSARDAEVYFDRTYHDDICIHEAPSLPCGGDYHGLEGVARHAIGFTRTWDRWQTGEQRQLGPRIIATDTEAIVLWTLRAQQPGDPAESIFPAISHYRSMTGVWSSHACSSTTPRRCGTFSHVPTACDPRSASQEWCPRSSGVSFWESIVLLQRVSTHPSRRSSSPWWSTYRGAE
jgi:hypothetical protein